MVSGLGLPLDTAWLKIDATNPITGFELFANTNLLAGYTGVGITGPQMAYLPSCEKNGATGIAFVNIEDGSAAVTLTAYDDGGTVIATETMDLNSYEKVGGYPGKDICRQRHQPCHLYHLFIGQGGCWFSA